MTKTQQNDLYDFMREVSENIASEYERIRKRSNEDASIAGAEGENTWAEIFEHWLPPTYHIETKGKIMAADGTSGPEFDVIVLSPTYPQKLRKKKQYLAGGVVAAFECKLTLKGEDIRATIERASMVRRSIPRRFGTPYKELHSPIIMGLLAHSHVWKSPESKPIDNIENWLYKANQDFIKHPREMLDFICVSDLATWSSARSANLDAQDIRDTTHPSIAQSMPEQLIITGYIRRSPEQENQVSGFTPVGALICKLLVKLAWEDPSIQRLADYFLGTLISGSGMGRIALWQPEGVFSESVRNSQISSKPVYENWSEWNKDFS